MKLIHTESLNEHRGPFFFALEEYLVKTLKPTEEYFFTWMLDPCVVIGRHQLLQSEVNQDFLSTRQIPVWRRPSGGGAVYADRNCVMFSFISSNVKQDMMFDTYLSKVVHLFQELGVPATFTGRNDLLVNGLKFSGNSFYRYQQNVILHGTLLFDVDLENLVRSITPSDEKLISKGITSVRQRVTNLSALLTLSKNEMISYLENHLCSETINLTPHDINQINHLAKKYETDEWINGKNPPYSLIRKKKLDAGNFEVHIDIHHGRIQQLSWFGDYFSLQPLDSLSLKFIGLPFTLDGLRKTLDAVNVSEYVFKLTNDQLLDIFFEERD